MTYSHSLIEVGVHDKFLSVEGTCRGALLTSPRSKNLIYYTTFPCATLPRSGFVL